MIVQSCKHGIPLFQSCSDCGREMVKSPLTPQFLSTLKPVSMVHGSSFTLFPKPVKKPKKTMYDYAKNMAKKRIVHPLKAKKKKSKPTQHKIKQVPISKRKIVLWELCKTYTKLRDGKLCVSCKKREGTQCGHFLPKSACNLVWKFHERNLGRQCSYCNLYLKGNFVGYEKHQIAKWGVNFVESMKALYTGSLPLSFNPRQYVEDKIKWYEKEIKKYEKKTH